MSKLLFYNQDRHASWLELFFDLIFVVAISNTTHFLTYTENQFLPPENILKFPFAFVVIWWIWITHTFFSNRFDDDGVLHRLYTLCIMLCVIILSIFIDADYLHHSFYFILVYSLLIGSFGVMTVYRLRQNNGELRWRHIPYLHYLVGALLCLFSLLFPRPLRGIIFYASLICLLMYEFIRHGRPDKSTIHLPHLWERVGLLTIIMLGDSIVNIADGLSEIMWKGEYLSTALFDFAILALIWWIYFNGFKRMEKRLRLLSPFTMIMSHLVLYFGLAFLSSAISHSILSDLNIHEYKGLLCLGMLLFFCGKQFLLITCFPSESFQLFRHTLLAISIFILAIILSDNKGIIIIGTFLSLLTYLVISIDKKKSISPNEM